MQTSVSSLGAWVLSSAVLFVPQVSPGPRAEPQEEAQAPTLKRLDPKRGSSGNERLQDVFARDFDAASWRERLAEPDLARRERFYEALLQRARLDPVARAFLEEVARGRDELAWTARLALRELGRARFPLQGLMDPAPFAGALDASQRLQQAMNELFARGGGLPIRAQGGGPVSGSAHQGTRVQIEQGPQGTILRLTETIDGRESTRTYSGASLQEILRQNTELESGLGALTMLGLRSPFVTERGLELSPQGLSLPRLTGCLGVIVRPLGEKRAPELGLTEDGRPYGLLVERAAPETYAQLLGVGEGDILLELNGVRLRSGDDIERIMRARAGGESLTLVWLDELGQRQVRTWPAPR